MIVNGGLIGKTFTNGGCSIAMYQRLQPNTMAIYVSKGMKVMG